MVLRVEYYSVCYLFAGCFIHSYACVVLLSIHITFTTYICMLYSFFFFIRSCILIESFVVDFQSLT